MRYGRRSSPGCSRSSACTRRWEAVGSREWRSRSMLFKPGSDKKPVDRVASAVRRRIVSIFITLIILGGLGYFGWVALEQKQRQGGGSRGGRPDLPVPVLAAIPRVQDVPVYL